MASGTRRQKVDATHRHSDFLDSWLLTPISRRDIKGGALVSLHRLQPIDRLLGCNRGRDGMRHCGRRNLHSRRVWISSLIRRRPGSRRGQYRRRRRSSTPSGSRRGRSRLCRGFRRSRRVEGSGPAGSGIRYRIGILYSSRLAGRSRAVSRDFAFRNRLE
jgi:hypothetical protein